MEPTMKRLSLFPGCSHLQQLITRSMQVQRGRAQEIWSGAATSGRHMRGDRQQRILKPILVLPVRRL